MPDLQKKVSEYCKENHLLARHDRIVIGVSGGADSVCLLRVLLNLREEYALSLYVVHVNHGLRKAAGEDADFVKALCEEWKVPMSLFVYDVAKEAEKRGMSLEEAGRAVRFEAYEEARKSFGANKVALAHHMDDQVETILWNLFRGSGAKGLTGIAAKREHFIRPLLCVSRKEITEFLTEIGQEHRTDETNSDNTYTRNRLRNRLIPAIEEEYNRQARKHIVSTGEIVSQMEDYVERQGEKAYARCVKKTSKRAFLIREKQLKKEEEILKRCVLRQALIKAAGSAQDIGRVHVQMLSELMDNQVGKELFLPYGVMAARTYDGIQLRKKDWADENDFVSLIEEHDAAFRFKVKKLKKPKDWKKCIREKTYTKCFDYDIIEGELSVRTRLPGDYIVIDDEGNTQKLKYYFINEKIPRQKRDHILLLAEGSRILWVTGYRIGANYRVTENTKRVLKVTLRKNGYGGNRNERKD